MKRIDFENNNITKNILHSVFPMLIAQIMSLLYNIVDRIYIARISGIGTTALGAVGLCFPVILIITAFSNLFGSGGSPLFSIRRGMGDRKGAGIILNTSFTMLCICAVVLMIIGLIFSKPILLLFGASENALVYARPYLMIYLLGTFPSMIATGMNPFITAQGYATASMLSVMIGAGANIILDPVFIFVLHLDILGAAIATIISQTLAAAFVLYFLHCKSEYRVHFLRRSELSDSRVYAGNIVSLGSSGFIMQLTNSLVSICNNNVLAATGGDLYISVMTIISSVRQIVETPIYAITEGSSPLISYNYGARRPKLVKKAFGTMAVLAIAYTLAMWIVILTMPQFLIRIFSSDQALFADAVPAMKLYFSAFIFMLLQYMGQCMFKSLNKKKQAIFFSLLRKAVIVVPLTYLLPYAFRLGTNGVFLAEPISNIIGGSLCFFVMLATVMPELRKMEKPASK